MKLLNNLYQVGGTSLSHGFDASAYLLKDARGYLLIDCGTPEGYAQIVQNIRSLGVNPGEIHTILATHGHYDHVGAANLWRRDFGCRLLVHPLDREQVEAGDSALTSASLLYGVEAEPTAVDGVLDTGDVFPVEGGSLEVLHTPGHTPGGVTYQIGDALFTGDTLFAHGYGRTDLPGGDFSALRRSLRRLLHLAGDFRVFPGHSESTTLNHERGIDG